MIIFDASTLILLAKIDLLGLFLLHAKTMALVPEAVRSEACIAGPEEAPVIIRLFETGGLKSSQVKNRNLLRRLMTDFSIDSGEAEAIAVALQEKGGIVATDDRNAIRACKMLGVKFITAISVLVLLCEKGVIARDEAMAKLDKLVAFARYRKEIITDAAKRIYEEH